MSNATVPLDRAARASALDAERSFIMQAPAGSGKTELLIQRYLALLARVANPEEVVAITFTRKAAGEMRVRIIDALAAARAGQAPHSDHERTTLSLAQAALRQDAERRWGLTDNGGRLRIQTIDSLCYSITGQMPLLSGLGTLPEPRDDASALYREAARETLVQLEDPDWFNQLATLLKHLDNDTALAEDLLARLLERRDQWIRHHGRFDRAELTNALANLARDRLQQARDAIPHELLEDLLRCARYAAGNLDTLSPLAGIAELPDVHPGQLQAWQAIAGLVLTQDFKARAKVDKSTGFPAPSESNIGAAEKIRRNEAKNCMQSVLQRIADLPELLDALAEVKRLPPPHYNDDEWQLIEALSPVLRLGLAQLELVFRARAAVDFTQLLIGANQALGEPDDPTDLALALDYRIRHLLIDEFQDTSLSQYELLRRLTAGWQPGDGRTLFAVGDPMQSIYRFREADVGLFLRARQHGIGTVALQPLSLQLNFRSQAGIVDWVNRAFAQVLPAHENAASGAVAYSPVVATRPSLTGEAVQFHPVLGEDRASEAQQVIDLVRAAQREDPTQSVAILVRSRNHLNAIVPALKRARLRFRALEIEALAQRPAILDLHALTRALVHLADRIAWLSVLRAPWCGLTLVDLERLTADSRDRVLWERMLDSEVVATLSADGQERLRRVVLAVAEALQHRGRGSLRRRVEGAWLRLGGPASVAERSDLDDVQVYLDLVEDLEQGGDLENLEALDAELSKLYAVPDVQAPETLQIMTIHKAKGLEFDCVILPGLSSMPRADDPELLRWVERPGKDGESDLLLAAITASGKADDPIYASVTRLLNQRQDHEDGRLLYVAATRARRTLHLVAQVKAEPDQAGTLQPVAPPAGALLSKLWPAVQADIRRALQRPASSSLALAPERMHPDEYPLRRLPVDWTLPPPPSPVPWQCAPREEEAQQASVEFSWAGESARHIGTVVHLLLQRVADEGLAAWNAARIDSMDAMLRLALRQEGVPGSELDAAHRRVKAALTGLLADPRAHWIFHDKHADARSEYRLTGELDGIFVNVIFDRTFVDDRGVRWIVDYKTGMHEGAGVDAFLDREQERYRIQLERYARLLARTERRPIRLGLYFPLLGGWREWAAADA